jgi:hypothetical protein
MATITAPSTCNTCNKCTTANCGCLDTMLTTPAPCPSPIGCPNPEPCSEVLNAECIIYTGEPIMCGALVLIPTNTNLADALQLIVNTLCTPA